MQTTRFDEIPSGPLVQRWRTALGPSLFASLLGLAACNLPLSASPDAGSSSPSRDASSSSSSRGSTDPSPSGESGRNPSDDGLSPRDDGSRPNGASDPDPASDIEGGSGEGDCGATTARYAVLPNGTGGFNLEGVSLACLKKFDKAASLAAFQSTVYPLLSKNCASCHSTETKAQAPILADIDVNLAHEYSLTRVNFRHPEDSKLVLHVELYLHHCFGRDCSDSRTQLITAIKSWASAVQNSLPEVPRLVDEGVKVSEEDVKQWIASDRAKLASADASFMVYVSLHEMHNDGVAADRLNVARVALSKVLNSTARWAPKIVNPVDINGKGMVYRFDTRSYWGYNKGVKSLIFGGSDDDIFFGDQTSLLSHRFNFARTVSQDANFAKMVWARVQQGSKEAPQQKGKAVNNKGFKSDYVELSQLIYTLSRPDVYNAIMAIPVYADELEDELGVVKTNGADSYQYAVLADGITFTARPGPSGGRQMFRAATSDGGYYWKSFDLFTGQGQVFPYFQHPLPKFVTVNGGSDKKFSLLASLAQPQSGSEPSGCNSKSSLGNFATCTNYTGTGGVQQHASETFWLLPNGMQAYAIFGGLNQRRTDAFTFIVVDPRRIRSAGNNGGSTRGDLRLNQAASCMGCHEDAMKRENADLRDQLDDGTLKASWTSDSSTVERVRKLYPTTKELRRIIEDDHKPFLEAMVKIRDGMVLGEDKNVYVEPIVWTFEWAQIHYKYADTVAN